MCGFRRGLLKMKTFKNIWFGNEHGSYHQISKYFCALHFDWFRHPAFGNQGQHMAQNFR